MNSNETIPAEDEMIYIELGGGSAARSLEHRTTLRRALQAGSRKLKKLGGKHMEDARIVDWLLTREWNQERTPYYASVSKRECKALSRALRADAYSLAGEAREFGLLGVGNVAYQEFRSAVIRSRRLLSNRRGMEARALMLEEGVRQAN